MPEAKNEKNKFYILFSLLIVILLFSVSALCNQCGIITPATTGTTSAGLCQVGFKRFGYPTPCYSGHRASGFYPDRTVSC